jgi:hypothetical protein
MAMRLATIPFLRIVREYQFSQSDAGALISFCQITDLPFGGAFRCRHAGGKRSDWASRSIKLGHHKHAAEEGFTMA